MFAKRGSGIGAEMRNQLQEVTGVPCTKRSIKLAKTLECKTTKFP